MATTTIRVSQDTRDHLAQLAKEHGLSLGQYVEQLAKQQPTVVPQAQRLAADREALRTLTGCDISGDEFDQAPDVLGNICRIAAVRVLAARGDVA
ncbi:hypothetical protein AB4Z54_04470 [Streptomyces sp. MCAF7]